MSESAELLDGGRTLLIRIPMRLKRRGGRKEVVAPATTSASADDPDANASPARRALLLALGRAHLWQDMLESGRAESISALAERFGVDRSYVGRILRLALLAPDIVEAIARGDEPSGLSLERLVKAQPLLWTEQRQRLGFPQRG